MDLPTIGDVFIGAIAVLMVVVLIGSIVYYAYNLAQPTVTRKVKVVGKRTSTTQGSGQHSPQTSYLCTFEYEDGQRKEYNVGEMRYALIAEGDRGELDTKGVLFWDFRRTAS
jgi:hypothetical protein